MKMIILMSLVLSLFTTELFAQSYKVERRDQKLATQKMIEYQKIVDPVLADADRILNDQASSSSVVTTVTSGFLAQPDTCRNITITPGGTTGSVPAGNITVVGKNKLNKTITEAIALTADQSTVATGNLAFCSVTSISIPVQDGAGATYDVGVGSKLGLKHCMDETGWYVYGTVAGVYEGTRATITADADEVEKNTVVLSTALDGSKDVELFFIQNYACAL